MYRSVLVPLDGSTFAEHALPIARSIARRAPATLQLVSVHVPIAARYVDGTVLFDEALDNRLKEHERAYLDEVVKRLSADSNVSLTATLLEGNLGSVVDALNEYAISTQADLIVMATHGRSAWSRFWLGSVADKLVRQVLVPILMVRPSEAGETQPDLTREQVFQHLLIPLDGSSLAEQILEPALTLGQLMQADYTLLRVVEPPLPISYPHTEYTTKLEEQLLKEWKTEAQTYLHGVAERLQTQVKEQDKSPLSIKTKVTISRYTANSIIEEASSQGIDLIAMATHGYGGLTRVVMGSVADKLLRGAPVPVLLRRPQGEAS
ncbi:MAG TPA: universal stress protein [Candidatus Limnocylindrales bacterium]|nr:universal stress protein [Candidatus Limnocylindrales bacterium]